MATARGISFLTYAGVDGRNYCLRVDGLADADRRGIESKEPAEIKVGQPSDLPAPRVLYAHDPEYNDITRVWPDGVTVAGKVERRAPSDDGEVIIGDLSNLPAKAPRRNARSRLPWLALEPGQWFRVPPSINADGIRNMILFQEGTHAGQFAVFRGGDDDLYVVRTDGMADRGRVVLEERDG